MSVADGTILTVEQARRIVASLYDALNRPGEKDVSALLAQACHDDYQSYHTNQDYLTRDQLAEVFRGVGSAVPDLAWEIADIRVVNDQVIVRGEATGTPVTNFFGAAPTGKSFGPWRLTYSPFATENWRKPTTSRIGRLRPSRSPLTDTIRRRSNPVHGAQYE